MDKLKKEIILALDSLASYFAGKYETEIALTIRKHIERIRNINKDILEELEKHNDVINVENKDYLMFCKADKTGIDVPLREEQLYYLYIWKKDKGYPITAVLTEEHSRMLIELVKKELK